MKLVLASASPRRRELIKSLNLEVEVIPSGADENIEPCAPEQYVKKLATLKARDVFQKTSSLTLGADTVVEVDGMILGKPKTYEQAEQMFRLLCGCSHRVLTGVCFIDGNHEVVDCEVTTVTFKPFDAKIIDEYIKTGSPFDKAGGYGIQDEMLAPIVASVDGELDNVIGLPVKLVAKILKEKFGLWTSR